MYIPIPEMFITVLADFMSSISAGYVNEGGGLTYVVVRNAGHMVPISQPRWAHDMVTQFTHYKRTEDENGQRFDKPDQMRMRGYSDKDNFINC